MVDGIFFEELKPKNSKNIVTITGDWNDSDYITKTSNWDKSFTNLMIFIQNFYDAKKELKNDIVDDRREALNEYLLKYSTNSEVHEYADSYAEQIEEYLRDLLPISHNCDYIHSIKDIIITIDGHKYKIVSQLSQQQILDMLVNDFDEGVI